MARKPWDERRHPRDKDGRFKNVAERLFALDASPAEVERQLQRQFDLSPRDASEIAVFYDPILSGVELAAPKKRQPKPGTVVKPETVAPQGTSQADSLARSQISLALVLDGVRGRREFITSAEGAWSWGNNAIEEAAAGFDYPDDTDQGWYEIPDPKKTGRAT